MTLPSTGSAISLAQIQTEFGGSNPISLNEYYGGTTNERSYFNGSSWALIPTSGTISCDQFFSSAARFAIGHDPFQSAQTYTQYNFGAGHSRTIGIMAIGAGGGGGGGSSRPWGHGVVQGGAGGGGGEMRATTITVTPGQFLNVFVGGGGSAGQARDGPYSAGSNGGAGGYSGALNSAQTTWYCLAYGGGGGQVATVNTSVNNQTVGAAGGSGGVGSFISPGNVGAHGPYTTAGSGKNTYVATQGGGFGGAGVYFHTFLRAGTGGNGSAGATVTHSNAGANSPGYGSFNWHGLSGTVAGAAAWGYTNSYFGVGGGGGGGGINNNDNGGGMQGGAGQPGVLIIFW